jgi:nucleotide-binding universal stress UspA family protein
VFKKILLPLDGSASAEAAIPWVTRYAAPAMSSVVLARVLDKIYPLKGMPFGAEGQDARVYLQGIASRFLREGIPTEIALPTDPVAPAIVSLSRRAKCNLIVLTTRGAARVVRWLIGGVTEQVIRNSPVPVLVVRSGESPPSAPQRILVPVDGSARSKPVLVWAERLARFHQVPLELLYVRSGGKGRRTTPERPTEKLSESAIRLCGLLQKRGLAASYRLEEGDPATEILQACRPTDLVVMTTHGYGGLKRLVKGSVAEKVIYGAPAPVFVSKRAARSEVPADGETLEGARPERAGGAEAAAPRARRRRSGI